MNEPRQSIEDLPIRSPRTPAILIRPDGTVVYGKSLVEKRELLAEYNRLAKKKNKKVKLLAVWPGEYYTDVFELTADKLFDCEFTDGEYWKELEKRRDAS